MRRRRNALPRGSRRIGSAAAQTHVELLLCDGGAFRLCPAPSQVEPPLRAKRAVYVRRRAPLVEMVHGHCRPRRVAASHAGRGGAGRQNATVRERDQNRAPAPRAGPYSSSNTARRARRMRRPGRPARRACIRPWPPDSAQQVGMGVGGKGGRGQRGQDRWRGLTHVYQRGQ